MNEMTKTFVAELMAKGDSLSLAEVAQRLCDVGGRRDAGCTHSQG